MPNWCDNQLSITGPNSVIDKIEKIVNDERDVPIGGLNGNYVNSMELINNQTL